MVLLTRFKEAECAADLLSRIRKWLLRLTIAVFVAGVVWAAPFTTGYAHAQGPSSHIVQPGENLSKIAARYGVSYRQLANYNGIRNPNHLRPGQVLRIPAPTPVKRTPVRTPVATPDSIVPSPVATNPRDKSDGQPGHTATSVRTYVAPTATTTRVRPTPTPTPRRGIHVVRRSETLSVIARSYGVSVSEIKRWNGIKGNTIYVGQRLIIFLR